jgi:hypothetical protein
MTSSTRASDELPTTSTPMSLAVLASLGAPFAAETAELFAQLDAMDAATDTEIHRYDAVDCGRTGMSVVEFVWHASVLGTDLPPGFGAAA